MEVMGVTHAIMKTADWNKDLETKLLGVQAGVICLDPTANQISRLGKVDSWGSGLEWLPEQGQNRQNSLFSCMTWVYVGTTNCIQLA